MVFNGIFPELVVGDFVKKLVGWSWWVGQKISIHLRNGLKKNR